MGFVNGSDVQNSDISYTVLFWNLQLAVLFSFGFYIVFVYYVYLWAAPAVKLSI